MLPKKLIMNAFGPYKQETVINFEDLVEHQLFLITGPTGSGKTTIFDGLIYALYGKPSGSSRREDELKSQFATDHDLAYVSLEFEVGGKQYQIKRIPAQQGPGKGKTKRTRKYSSEVIFITPDNVYTKINEANVAIQQVVGLTMDQFKQIVMLPQGEFKKLLEAPSKDKQAIFRKIFNTDILQIFESKLKEKSAHLKKESDRLRAEINDYSERLLDFSQEKEILDLQQLADQEHYADLLEWAEQKLEDLLEDQASLKLQLTDLTKQINQYENSQTLLQNKQQLEEKLARLDQQRPEIETLQASLNKYRQTIKIYQNLRSINELKDQEIKMSTSISRTEKELESVIADLNQIKPALIEAKINYDELPALRADIKRLENDKNKWQEFNRLSGNATVLNQKIENNQQQLVDLKVEHASLISRQQASQEEQACLKKDIDQLDRYKELLAKNEQAQLTITSQQQDLTKIKEIESSIQASQNSYDESQHSWKDQQVYVRELEQVYQNNLAGILASNLVADQACPVCGSKNHPQKATMTAKEVDKYFLDKERQKESHLFEKTAELGSKLNSLQTQGQQLRAEGNWTDEEVAVITSNLIAKQETLKAENEEIMTKITTINQFKARQDQLSKITDKLQADLLQMIAQEATLEATLSSLVDQLKEIEASKDKLQVDLVGQSLDEVVKRITVQEDKVQEIDSLYQKYLQEDNQLRSQVSVLKERLEGYGKQKSETSERLRLNNDQFQADLSEYQLSEEGLRSIHEVDTDWSLQEERIQSYTKDLHTVKTQLTDTSKQLDANQATQTPVELNELIALLKREYEALQAKRDRSITCSTNLKQVKIDFKAKTESYQDYAKQFGELSTLSDIANGNLTGSTRISFERYVLGQYFNEIIVMANLRFNKMTAGRYEFRHDQSEQKGSGAKGLELSVYDFFAGSERSVQSLSGGEGFKASLSLALGLSDVMQAYAGGIEVNTLFIDEGFGTLDQESLQQAIQTLMQLQEESGRLIGIISHVEELKQQVPVHLEISTTEEGGSSCKFKGVY